MFFYAFRDDSFVALEAFAGFVLHWRDYEPRPHKSQFSEKTNGAMLEGITPQHYAVV